MERLYLYVTKDKYEFPEFITDDVEELARYAGVTKNAVESSLSKLRNGIIKRSKYREVVVDENE